MQISPIKNPNFEKPSRDLSNRTKVKLFKKTSGDISQKNLVPRMLSHHGNVRTSKFFVKIDISDQTSLRICNSVIVEIIIGAG